MSGKPQIVGLLALAVALWFASPLAAPPAYAQIRVPLPGLLTKEKVVKPRRRYVRPTLPWRNPTRVTAGLSATAVSPPQAKNSAAAAAAGATSSGSVSLALPRIPEPASEIAEAPPPADAPADDAKDEAKAESKDEAKAESSASDEDTEVAEAKPEASESQPAETETDTGVEDEAETASGDTDEPVETAADDAAEQAATDATAAASAVAEAASESADSAADAEAIAEASESAAKESAAKESAAKETTDEKAEEKVAAQAEASATLAADEPDAAAAEANGDDAKETAAAQSSPETSEKDETSSAQGDTKTAAAPDHDASVVLEVAPPPEDAPAAKDETPSTDADETRVAVLTAPSTPDGRPPAVVEEKSETKDSDSAASDAGSEKPSKDADAQDPAETADDETPTSDDGVAESEAEDVVEEPAPPPAHPVVAQVREKLEDPGLGKALGASDLKALKAFYGAHEGPPLWVDDEGFTAKAQALITEIGKADDWGLEAASFKLPPANDPAATPDALADGELQLSVAILSYARDAQIGRLTPRSVSKLFDQHPTLRDPQTVLKEVAAADNPSAYLVSLHPQHDQFKRLRKALLRARENAELGGRNPRNDRDVQLITINMERWRWLPRSLGNYHVWNNVPEFNVRVKKGGQTIYQEKTIVGQLKYATPFFSAKIRTIVFHPNWTVPPTIVREDIAPKLQGHSGGGLFGGSKDAMLRRYGLRVSYKGEPISADSVDWNSVNVHAYTFTQDPGPANVLGKFKFNFPNKHAIYMHDTVQPELFAQRTRTLSHGCIRVNQPDRFASLLLGQDKGWSQGNVRSLVAKNESKVIALKRHVPVHLTYFTAVVDEHGNLNKVGDIYGIDGRIAPKLFKNPATFPAPTVTAVAEPSQAARTRPRRRQSGSRGFNNFMTGLFGN